MRLSRAIQLLSNPIGLGLILFSCTTVFPTSQPSKTPELTHQTVKISSKNGWLPEQAIGNKQYLFHDSSTISINADSTHTRINITNTIYSVRLSQLNDSLRFTARVDSLTIISQASSPEIVPDTGVTQESEAVISPMGQIFSLSGHSFSLCPGGITPAAARIHELLVSYPRKALKVGDKWVDTVSTTVCRGKILVLQQTIRQYNFVSFSAWNRQSAAKILCIASSTLHTDSKNSPKYFSTHGSATSSMVIYVNQVTGTLLQSDAHSEATLIVNTSRGVFPFRQIINTHIELR
ncbi:MAG TPA: hypothetical protein VIM15_10835 [Gemmatimonadaceae bacterium]